MSNTQTLKKPKFKYNGGVGCVPTNRNGKYKDYARRLLSHVYTIHLNPTGFKSTTRPKPMVFHKKVAPEYRSILHPYSIEINVEKARRGKYLICTSHASVYFGDDGQSGVENGVRLRYAEGEEIDAKKRLY